MYPKHIRMYPKMCIGSAVVRVMDSHSRPGFKPQPRQSHIRYALNSTQFISDESSVELVLYLCE